MRKRLRFKSKLRFTLFLMFVIAIILNGGRYYFKDNNIIHKNNRMGVEDSDIIDDIIPTKKGTITILNMDAVIDIPIKNTEYVITDLESGEVIELLITDEDGRATSSPLNYDATYEIKQVNIKTPYELRDEVYPIEINNENHEITIKNNWLEFIKAVEPIVEAAEPMVQAIESTDDGNVKITEVYIPVGTIMQKPELPNGCEITSLTAVLNYYGYEVSKTEMADVYLPKEPFIARDGTLYGANPYKAYAGDPRDQRGGFYVFAPPIVDAAKNYFEAAGGNMNPIDVSQSTREEIIDYLNEGIPVVIWMTIDLKAPRIGYAWYFHDTEETYSAYVNLHSVVINGYVEDNVHIMDPLKGQVIYNADEFFASYYSLGSHAMVIVEE
ncbi:C39 family peptidase [Anaerovirgula multivorans]|uniref:C39 family peptidase n=1 Tax=Anaerovirgula multivorans TaxID=312168 RepID=UPI0015955C1C|nr:C39 family peptidase [Anaerovirgula multivorans]